MDFKNKCCFAFACVDLDRSFLPFAVSIRSMIEKVQIALEAKHAPTSLKEAGIKIPSRSYVGMQFAPKDKTSTTALAYTGDAYLLSFLVFLHFMLTMH
jgi:hypothetical protein